MPKFDVFFAQYGYAQIEAETKEEAECVANEELKYAEVSWNDDWEMTDIMEAEA